MIVWQTCRIPQLTAMGPHEMHRTTLTLLAMGQAFERACEGGLACEAVSSIDEACAIFVRNLRYLIPPTVSHLRFPMARSVPSVTHLSRSYECVFLKTGTLNVVRRRRLSRTSHHARDSLLVDDLTTR